ncbi:hypothetical protein RUM44_010685 [Polyplax serrata]|uniref:Rap-GAP domain-containing protein n=1 Tax=Polyplax serrata TaxID=468196 RepID=A0ABR1AMX3_POLSC
MSGRDKEIKPLEKLKQFFRAAKGSSVNFKGKADFVLTCDVEKGISTDAPINQRIRTIKDLSEIVATCRLEDYAVEKLWTLVRDLLHKDVEKEHRHVCLHFLKCLVQGQYEKLGIMRSHFFKIIKNHGICEDVACLLELLQALTDNGRDILHLEDEFSDFLLKWTPEVINAGKAAEILGLLLNVIKYNASYIDDCNIVDVVDLACFLCSWSNKDEVITTSLQVLDTIVCYSNLPPDSLSVFICALCRKVNIHEYSHNCWKIMRNLLGTHMGHSTLYTMCKILQDTTYHNDVGLLRGTVFYINMGLWSNKRVTSLRCTLTSVLPSLLQAMQCNHTVVVYEITLSTHRLVNKFGLELQDPAWDVVLSILEAITKHVESRDATLVGSVGTKLHETLCTIEQLIELGQFNGNVRRVFSLIEMSSCMRPESSVLRLINFLSGSIVPTRYEWLTKLDSLLDKYYNQDSRPNVRVKALEVLSSVVNSNKLIYEDELIERVVVPHLQYIDQEVELNVRNVGVQILVNLCLSCESKKCLELLAILEKLLIRRDQNSYDPTQKELTTNENEGVEVKSIVSGLIKVFTIKLHQLPSNHALKAYKILISFLENYYRNPVFQEYNQNVPFAIFECLLKLRVNKIGHIGLMDSTNSIVYSPYLMIESKLNSDKCGTGTISPPPASPAPSLYPVCTVTPFSFASASKVIVTALKTERDWKILSLLLQELPSILQNKSLMLGRHGTDIGQLADALCSMVSDKSLNLPDSLRNVPQKLNRTEFQSYVFPVIAAISSYHTNLEPSQQQRCIKCLEYGLASRCASQCVMALTTCTLEMRDAMYKLLPEVLLNLSKISATIIIAIPILEFLSTLTSLPKVFASFVGDQYMSVFAIALPYTNPFKYNHYTVSLAHHVIAVWFLKCRLPFRRDFVRFITTGLKANAIAPFEEEKLMKSDLSSLNEDSTSRKRSSSLTEQGSRRRERPLSNAPRLGTDLRPPMDETLFNFHVELTETCIDLMARYTFSSCSARPKRSPIAEFLLNGGQSQTWLLGHKLITVTTSGCSQKPLKNNLCDRCWMVCKSDKKFLSPESEDIDREDLLKLSRQNSGDKNQDQSGADFQKFDMTSGGGSPTDEAKKSINNDTSKLEQLIFKSHENGPSNDLCACWCQGWAEIYVKRPTGDMSWVLRIQNETNYQNLSHELPLPDVTTLFLPGNKSTLLDQPSLSPSHHQPQSQQQALHPPTSPLDLSKDNNTFTSGVHLQPAPAAGSGHLSVAPGTPSRQSSRESVDEINYDEEKLNTDGDGSNDLSGKSRNPVRRSNSSPEMSASWKNPFLKEHSKHDEECTEVSKQKQTYGNVSCEAIPEEMSGMGTTPPDTGSHQPVMMPVPQAMTVASKPPPHSLPPQPIPGQKKLAHQKLVGLKREGPKFDAKSILDEQTSLSVDTGEKVAATKAPLSSGELGKCESNRSLNSEENRPDLLQTYKRDRSRTISVMSPARKSRYDNDHVKGKLNSPRTKEAPRSGVSPSFVFLQLYHSAHFGSTDEKPILISQNSVIQRAILTLDFIPPFETHKVGVIYVGPGQANCEAEILRNEFGSLRYAIFLQNLGTLINLKNADPKSTFLGGLGKSGVDGKFAYIWQDDVTQVTFHVATLMPNKESDPNCNAKKAHIGNDFVTIVYNESGEDYNIQTVKGQFNYANVIIQPLDHSANKVVVKVRDELADQIGHSELKIVSDQNLAILARQLALHANLASLVSRSLKAKNQDPYASNWLERLRKIKRLRQKVLQLEISEENSDHKEFLSTPKTRKADYMDDFTEYT